MRAQRDSWPTRRGVPSCGRAWTTEGELRTESGDSCWGVDISAGTGASNSTAVIYDRATGGEKIAEYANSNILPMDFARFCMALGRAFNKARIIPDRSGPTGEVFTKTLITEGYGNVYYRRQREERLGRDISDEPGVWLNPVQKTSLLIRVPRCAWDFPKMLNRSKEAMKECLQFIRKMDGTIEHSGSINAQGPRRGAVGAWRLGDCGRLGMAWTCPTLRHSLTKQVRKYLRIVLHLG